MSSPSSDSILPGVLIVIIMLPVLHGIGRAAAAIGGVWTAYVLEPLAPMVSGHVERNNRRIVGTYEGVASVRVLRPETECGILQPAVIRHAANKCVLHRDP